MTDQGGAVATQVAKWLESRLERYLADLATLVNHDSWTRDKAGVDRVVDWLADRGHGLGARSERRAVDAYGDLLLLRWTGTGGGRVLLSGHADTVFPTGTVAERPFRVEPATASDGHSRAHGPGVADMKAGLLTALYALEALMAADADWAEVAFIIGSEEEVGSPVSREWLTELAADYDAALVLEAARANGNVVTGRKGGGFWRVHIEGRAAHAGVEPEAGASALLQLAHTALALDEVGRQVPGASVVIGTAKAGEASNMVPPHAEMTVDGRAWTLEALDAMADAIRAAVDDSAGRVPGTTVRLEGGVTKAVMERGPASLGLYERARRVGAALGLDLGEQATGGTSDANFLAAAGLPVLDGLGPVGGKAHTADEYLEIDSIVPRTALLAGLIADLSVYP